MRQISNYFYYRVGNLVGWTFRSHENATINIVVSKTLFSRLRVFLSHFVSVANFKLSALAQLYNMEYHLRFVKFKSFFFNFLFIIILSLANLQE